MLANFSQYSPQGLLPQFPQMIPGAFLQPGAHGSYAPFGYDPRQQGIGQYPFGFGSVHPYLQSHLQSQGQGLSGQVPAQIATYLVQIAQQIFAHTTVAQQIGTALYQLAQQLRVQTHPLAGLDAGFGAHSMIGAGQSLGYGTPFPGSQFPGGQSFMQHPFATGNPQTQSWNANRPPTIQ
jgi:hypothetical protein